MYICMYVCMYVCTYVHIYVCTCLVCIGASILVVTLMIRRTHQSVEEASVIVAAGLACPVCIVLTCITGIVYL